MPMHYWREFQIMFYFPPKDATRIIFQRGLNKRIFLIMECMLHCNIYSRIPGASHTDDAPYLIYSPRLKSDDPDPPAVGTKDRITMERMTRMWTNFAKTG